MMIKSPHINFSKYVIGFPDSARVKLFFERNQLNDRKFHLIEAVDGRNLPFSIVNLFEDKFIKHQLQQKNSKWLQSTMGCLFSHIKAMEQAQEADLDYVVIAEDDAHFRSAPDPFIDLADRDRYDVIYLNDRMSLNKQPRNKQYSIEKLSVVNLKGTGAESYILSRRAVNTLLKQFISSLSIGIPAGYDAFLQSTALEKKDSIKKPGGKSILDWFNLRKTELKCGILCPTIVAHHDCGKSLICLE